MTSNWRHTTLPSVPRFNQPKIIQALVEIDFNHLTNLAVVEMFSLRAHPKVAKMGEKAREHACTHSFVILLRADCSRLMTNCSEKAKKNRKIKKFAKFLELQLASFCPFVSTEKMGFCALAEL